MRLRRLRRAGLILALAGAHPAVAQSVAADEEVVLAVTINGAEDNLSAVFLRRTGHLWARTDDLDDWRITHPGVEAVKSGGTSYVDLAALPGVTTRLDDATQTLAINVPVDLFARQSFSGNAPAVPRLTQAVPAAFVNYDIAADANSDATSVRGFFEVGASNRLGLAETTFTAGNTFGGKAITRLDSFFLRDDVGSATRLTVGDAITAGSIWSRPIRFGGIKFGTDFGLRPGYVTFPTADFQGRTVLPSSVEFYANGALRYRRDIDRGPFAVDQAPLPSGAGELTVVTRDVLGVERRTTTPYYVSTSLLRAGLSRYSIELGEERDRYGEKSFDYSRPFVSGLYRRGLTNRLTVEGRSEIGSRVQNGGVSVVTALPVLGELSGTVALSSTRAGAGVLWGASYTRVSERVDVGLSIQQTTSRFNQLGIRRPEERIRRQVQGNAGRSFGRLGRLSFSLADLKTADHNETRVASASYSVNTGRFGYLDTFALISSSSGGHTNTGLGVGLTIPLGPRTSARGGVELQKGRAALTADYRVSPPTDRGFGYGGNVRLGAFSQQRADATWLGDRGEVRVDVARVDDVAGIRATARGGIALAENSLFFTRQLDGAFGIVDAAGYGGVRVYQENRPLTRTNSRGYALIPALRPYDNNAIRLAPDDMPIGARVDADDIMLVPGYKAGVTAHFKVRTGRPATVIVAPFEKQEMMPGSAVSVDGGREKTFMGYNGAVFIADARPSMTLDIDVPGGTCRVAAVLPAALVDLPQVGPLACVRQGAAK